MLMVFLFFDVAALFFHLILFYYSIHVVIDGQILQFISIISFVEYHFELIVHCVGALVSLLWRKRWRREYRVYRDPN